MKRWLAIGLAIVMMIVLAGCGDVTTQKSAPAKDTKQEQKADSAATKNTVVAEATGLGNTLEAWTKEYGAPTAHGDTLKGFKNDAMMVTFDNGKAVNITIKNSNAVNPAKLLPKDGEKLSESSKKTSNGKMVVRKYHSALLDAAIAATKGNYTVIETYEGTSLVAAVIDCTPNLSK